MSVDTQQHSMNEVHQQEAQEEAHIHFVTMEFSNLLETMRTEDVLELLTPEAKHKLTKAVISQYNHKLLQTTGL